MTNWLLDKLKVPTQDLKTVGSFLTKKYHDTARDYDTKYRQPARKEILKQTGKFGEPLRPQDYLKTFPKKDFNITKNWLFEKLKPPVADIATIGRALPQVKSPLGAVKKVSYEVPKRTGSLILDKLKVPVSTAYKKTAEYFKPTEKVRVRDVVGRLPATGEKMLGLGTTMREEMSKSGGSLALSLHNLFADIKGEEKISEYKPSKDAPKLEQGIHQFVFGKESVRSLEKRMIDAEKKVREFGEKAEKETGSKFIKKYALPISVIGVGAITALDFAGFGGGKKEVFKLVARMNDTADIAKTLRQVGVAEDLILPTAKKLKGIKDPIKVESAFRKIDLLQKSTKVSPIKPSTKALETMRRSKELPKPITKPDPLITEARKYIKEGKSAEDMWKADIFPKSKIKETVYHGTDRKFKAFDIEAKPSGKFAGTTAEEEGIWFTRSKAEADSFGDITVKSKVNVKNPRIVDNQDLFTMEGGRASEMAEAVGSGNDALILKADNGADWIWMPDVKNIKTKSQLTDIYNKAKAKPFKVTDIKPIHRTDRDVMVDFIDNVRLRKAQDIDLEIHAGSIAEEYGFKLPKTRAGIADSFQEELTKRGMSYDSFAGRGVEVVSETLPKAKEVVKKIPEVKPKITPSEKIMKALKEAKPLRKEQEIIYTKERGIKLAKMLKTAERTVGEKGFYAELGALKGKMTKVEFASIRDKISQTDIDDLFDQVKMSQNLSEWDKLPARKGLAKMLGEEGGVVPKKNEMDMMKEVFGNEFVKTIAEKRTLFAKMKEAGIQLLNVPRSIMASFDLSAPLRQGLFFVGKPKHFFSAFKSQFKVFGSERAFKALNSEIASRPTYKLMKQNKLALTDLGNLSNREEAFLSNWAEEIPLVGKGVRASSRAYTGFLNKMRADVFDDFVKQGEKLGIDDPKFLKSAANFVNTATGRGGLGPLEKASVELSTIFFSPRLTMSRLNLINPIYYAKLEPTVRKEALKSLFSLAGIAATIGGLAKMGGADVNIDPRNADFMKLRFGNTRYDILGGFQQPIRTVAQVATGKIISSTTGEEMTLGEGYKPLTRVGVISRYFKYKMSPVASFAYALMEGRTAIGEKVDIPTEVANRFIPMVANDMYELYKEQGAKGIPMGIPAIFGVGSQTYGGVQSYGMKGKEYPELNDELNRLKMSMGFPSTSAFGYELTNKEYKEYKKTSGKMIADILNDIIKDEFYLSLEDKDKKGIINKAVDKVKKKTKEKKFADKKIKQEIKKRIIDKKGLSEAEAEKLAEEIYKKEFGE